jgi:hypothetical protein
MVELTDKLIAIIIPNNVIFDKTLSTHLTYLCDNGWEITEPFYIPAIDGVHSTRATTKILGTITKTGEFDFDCTDYVGKSFNGKYYQFLSSGVMRAASLNHSFPFETKEESFISLLNSKGVFLDKLNNQKLLILERCTT